MSKETQIKPFINIGPGYTIKKYLEARGWSQEDLSQLIDISAKQLSKIVNDKGRITIDTARLLSKAFETSAEFWINLDTNYRLNTEPNTAKENVTQRKSQIRKYMPVSEILKKGWYRFDNTVEGYEALYEKIWGEKSNDTTIYENIEKKYCARQKKDNEEFTQYYSLTWQQIARLKARDIQVQPYDKTKVQEIIKNFTYYTYSENGLMEIIKDLNESGIKFFVLSHLSKTYLDGACFLDNDNPVIVYTGRYDRIDNFWFTLAHEIAHVMLHLPKLSGQCFLDDLKEGEATSEQEKEADQKAEKILRVEEILTISQPYTKYFSEEKLKFIAKKLQIEQSVIVGVLQHKGLVDYRKLNRYKTKVVELFPKRLVLG
jgi:HTH-type transcriptional regulator / antitoxin HigA